MSRGGSLAVLSTMINSSHWHPHIMEKWKLLEYFTLVPDDSHTLRRCMDNLKLMRGIKEVSKPAVTAPWLVVLLLMYKESILEVWK